MIRQNRQRANHSRVICSLALASLLCLSWAPGALAAPLETASVSFENLDTPPFYFKATVEIEVYEPGNASSPVFSASDYTYVYRLTNLLAPPPAGQVNIPLDIFEIGLGSVSTVSLATSLDDPTGVAPSAITTSETKVSFSFSALPLNPDAISDPLILQSSSAPGDVNATVGLSSFVDNQVARGPAVLPMANFPCFDANVVKIQTHLYKSGKDKLKIAKGAIDLGLGNTFDPATDVVKLDLGDGLFVKTLPAGSFVQKGKKQRFRYKSSDGATPKIHFHLNFKKKEWEFKFAKGDAVPFTAAQNLPIVLTIGGAKGETVVPLYEKSSGPKKTKLRFKRHPRVDCGDDEDSDSHPTCHIGSHSHHHKRSCLSFLEVVYKAGTADQETLQKFSDDIGHPKTLFVAAEGKSGSFHSSCSQCLTCGQLDDSGLFQITGIVDANGTLASHCGVVDASCTLDLEDPAP